MREELNNLNVRFDPELLELGLEHTFYIIKRGITSLEDVTIELHKEFGVKILPYIKGFYSKVRYLSNNDWIIEYMDSPGYVDNIEDVSQFLVEEPPKTEISESAVHDRLVQERPENDKQPILKGDVQTDVAVAEQEFPFTDEKTEDKTAVAEKPAVEPVVEKTQREILIEKRDREPAKLRKDLNNLNLGVNPETVGICIRVMYYNMQLGILSLKDNTIELYKAVGKEALPYIKSAYEALRQISDSASFRNEMDSQEYVDSIEDVSQFLVEEKPKTEISDSAVHDRLVQERPENDKRPILKGDVQTDVAVAEQEFPFTDEKTEDKTAVAEKPAEAPVVEKTGEEKDREELEALRKRLKAKLNNLNVGIDPELLIIGIRLSYLNLKLGARSLKQFTIKLYNGVGNEVLSYVKILYEAIRQGPDIIEFRNEMDSQEYVNSIEDVSQFLVEEQPEPEISESAVHDRLVQEQEENSKVPVIKGDVQRDTAVTETEEEVIVPEELEEAVGAKYSKINVGLNPKTLALGIELSYLYVKRGTRTLKQLTIALYNDFGKELLPYVKLFYEAVRQDPDLIEFRNEMDSQEYVNSIEDVSQFLVEEPPKTEISESAVHDRLVQEQEENSKVPIIKGDVQRDTSVAETEEEVIVPEELEEAVGAQYSKLNVGINPDTLAACIELTFYIVEDGVRSLKDVTRALYKDFGEKILPYVKSVYLSVKNLPDSDAFRDEMDSSSYVDNIEDVSQFLVEEPPKTEISESAVHDRLVQEQEENSKVPIIKGDVQRDTAVTETEEEVIVPEELEEAVGAQYSKLNVGIDPELYALLVRFAYYDIKLGTRKYKRIVNSLYSEFGNVVIPYMKSIYEAVRGLPESDEFRNEMDSQEYVNSIEDVSQFLVEEPPKTEISESAVHDRLVQEQEENSKVPIIKGDVQRDTSVTETEEEVIVPEELEEAVGAQPEERVEGDEIPAYEPLIYDPANDPFSHKLKVFLPAGRKFQGYEDWESDVELDKALLDPEFLKRAETRVVVKDFNGTEAIYVEFIDGDKRYVAAVAANPAAMKSGGYVYSKTPGVERLRENNLIALRNKIIRIANWIKGTGNNKFKIIGTVATSNGRFTRNKVGDVVTYTPLQKIKLFGIPNNPAEISESTVMLGIADGENIYVGKNLISYKGGTYGQTYLILDPKRGKFTPSGKQLIFSVDSAHFSERMAKYIIQLMLLGNNTVPGTPFKARQLLRLIVHSGRRTIPTEKHTKEVADNMMKKLLYNEYNDGVHTSTIISNYRFQKEDLQLDDNGNPINERAYNAAVRFVVENMTWNINRDLLYEKLNKTITDDKNPLFGLVEYMIDNNLDKLVLIPGELEFDAEDLGIVKEGNQASIDGNKGINYLGWTIKNNRLVTDALPERPLADVWTYLQDVHVELDETARPQTEEITEAPVEKVLEKEVERTTTKEEAEEIVSKEDEDDLFDETSTVLDKSSNYQKDNNVVDASESSEKNTIFGAPMTSKKDGTINLESAKKWLAEKLGLSEEDGTLVIVDDVITLMKTNLKAVGLTKEDCILLYNLADQGVEFHEAWHRVSNLLIDEKRRNKIYERYRAKHKVDISDAALDEIFAEMYREFQLSKAKTIDYNTNNWFKKIISFVKTFNAVSDYRLAKLYYDINIGNFKNVKPSESNIARFKEIYGNVGAPFKLDGVEFEHINSTAMFNDIVENLKFVLLKDASQLSDVDEIKIAKVKRLVKNTAKKSALFKEVYEKFDDVFVPALKKNISKMSINLHQVNEAEAAELMDSGDNVASSIQDHTVASYEESKLKKTRPIVKFIFGTIPVLKYDVDGKMSFVPSIFTGLPKFYNINKALNKTIAKLSKCNSVEELLKTVNKLAESSSFFRALKGRLAGIKDEQTWTQLLITLRSNVMNFDTLRITTNKTDEGKTVKLEYVDNTSDRKAYIYPRVWSEQFLTNSNIFQQDESGKITFVPDTVKDGITIKGGRAILSNTIEIYKRLSVAFMKDKPFVYNDVSYDLNDDATCVRIKHLLVAMFNRIGVGINLETLEDVLNSSDYTKSSNMSQRDVLNAFFLSGPQMSRVDNFIDLLSDIIAASNVDKNGNISIVPIKYGSTVAMVELNSIMRNSGFIINLAQYHSKNNMSDEESMAFGANGNKLYKVSSNNTITQIVDDLNRSKDEAAKLMSTVYAKGSLILKTVSTSKVVLKVSTFINFRENNSNDSGRDYSKLSPLEDYIAKMTAVFKDKILFPTMADKKTYNFLSGIPLFHGKVNYKKVNGKLVKTYDRYLLDQMLAYAADDLAAIELCMEQLDPSSDKYLKPSKQVKNYHTGAKNGLKFRTITGVYIYKNGKEEFINFNDDKLTPRERIQLFKDTFYGDQISLQDKQAMLSTLLEKEIDTELKYAKNLGLIDFDYLLPDGSVDITKIKNLHLDTHELASRKERYLSIAKSDSVATSLAIYDMIADYTSNGIVSVIEIEKVFSGDPAFYSGVVDKIKRLGGLISTGVDNRVDFVDAAMADNTYACAELKDVEIGYHSMQALTSMFVVSDIRSALMSMEKLSAKEADELVSANVKVEEDGTVSINKEFQEKHKSVVAAAKDSAEQASKTYSSDINVTDASVYVSPKMYEKMMRRIGNWNSEVRLAFRILTEEKDMFLKKEAVDLLTSRGLESSIKHTSDGRAYLPAPADNWTSNPALYSMATKTALNALKYTAFGRRYQDGLAVPYYNKMAIFPLFKTIAHGESKKFYERMNQPGNEVDMLMFNSAVKVGSQGAIDPFEDYENGTVSDLNTLSVYRQDFKYLRQQFPTDPHEHMEQLAGTQMLKQGLSNLDSDGLYGRGDNKLSGSAIAETIFSVMNELSNRAATELANVLFNKNRTINEEALAKMLLEDAISSDANDNVISGLKIENGKFKYPLSSMSDSSWLESRFIAFINKKVIDIQLAGGTFIQRSSFGFRSDSGIIGKEGFQYINEGKRLNLANVDGTMDAVISITMFKDVIPNYDKLTFEQARSYLFSMGIIGNDSAPAIGYRIPTQAISSISALKFVDVVPGIMADTVILPEGFTKLTGSGYSIDKLFIARYEYGQTELTLDDNIQSEPIEMFNSLRDESLVSKIQFSAPNNMLSEKALKNKLVDTYLKVLLTKTKFTELKSSVDSATKPVKELLKDIEGTKSNTKGSVLEYYTPRFQEEKKQEYSTGKSGIGPMALNAAHHVLTQLYNVRFKGNKFIEELGLERVDGIYDRNENKDGSRNRILDWLSAMINAFVDMAKDPYIIRLNVTPWTYNMTTFLLRTGVGKYTFYFLSQPILKEMSSEIAKYDGVYGIDSYKSKSELRKQAIKNVLAKYDHAGKIYRRIKKQLKEDIKNGNPESLALFNEILNPKQGSDSFLTRDLIKNKRDFDLDEYNEHQVRMYVLYEMLEPYSQNLSDLVKYSKVDTKKTGKTFFEQEVFMNGVNEFMKENVFEDVPINRLFNESYLNTKIENSIGFISRVFRNKLLRTTGVVNEIKANILDELGKSTTASNKLCVAISRAIEANVKASFFDNYMQYEEVTYEDILFSNNSTAVKLLNIRNKILSGEIPGMLNADGSIANTLLENLIPEISTAVEDFISPSFIKKSSVFDADVSSADDMINSWRDLLDSDIDEIREFAEELVIYSFITSGDTPGSNSFFKYVPIEYKEKIGYNQHIKEAMYNLGGNSNDYVVVDQVYRNNWFNNELVKPVKFSEFKYVFDPIQGKDIPFNNTFRAVMSKQGLGSNNTKYPLVFIGERIDGTPMSLVSVDLVDAKMVKRFSPYVKMRFNNGSSKDNTIVYKLVKNIGEDGNTPLYVATTKLGYKKDGFSVVEYGDCRFKEYSFDQTPLVVSMEDKGIIDYTGHVITFLEMLKDKKLSSEERYILSNLLNNEEALQYGSDRLSDTDTEDQINDIKDKQKEQVKAESKEVTEAPKQTGPVRHKVQFAATGKERQEYTVTGTPNNWRIFNKNNIEVYIGNSRDRNKILSNLAIKLGNAAIISYKGNSYIVIDNGNIVSIKTGSIMSIDWAFRKEVLTLGINKINNNKANIAKKSPTTLDEEINQEIKTLTETIKSANYELAEKQIEILRGKLQNATIDKEIENILNSKELEFKNRYTEGISDNFGICYVDYSIPTQFIQESEDWKYALVKFPTKGNIVFPYRRRSVARRGYMELNFQRYLQSILGNQLLIIGDCSILPTENYRPYEPDIAIIDLKQPSIRIDIEIDEPYSAISNQPIHFIGCGDDFRDMAINNLGWIVIRLTENQVFSDKQGCAAFIAQIIHAINPKIPILEKSGHAVTAFSQHKEVDLSH